MKKFIIPVIAVLLAAVLFSITPIQVFAATAANSKRYIEDIVIVPGNDNIGDYTIKKLVPEGYTLIPTPIYDGGTYKPGEGRMNKGYICYKTTTDPTKAITAIKALNMNAQWDYDTYNQYLEQSKADVAKEVDELAIAVAEFQDNYESDYPKSNYVYEVLQYLYDDKSESPLGELFDGFTVDENGNLAEEDKEILYNILLMSNAQCINVIYNALTLSCSETPTNSFLDIISWDGFDAFEYATKTEYNIWAQDIVDTIGAVQEEIKKYERSLRNDEANVFTVPTDEKTKATYDMVKKMIADDETGDGVFDQYIEYVLGSNPIMLNPSERRMMIETGLANVAWYAMDSEKFTSMQDVYKYMPTIVSAFKEKKLTADAYNKKIDERINNYKNNGAKGKGISQYFEDYLFLYYIDSACYSNHLLDIMENKTGKHLTEVLQNCKYRGYHNEFKTLYDLVMEHDMTVPAEERSDDYALSEFYPIIAQLSPGQRGMLKTGFMNLILSVTVTDEEYEKSFEILQEQIKILAGGECYLSNVKPDEPCYSIYDGVDESLFEKDSGIAMMKSAIESTQKEFQYQESKEAYKVIFKNIGIYGGATAAVAGAAAITAGIVTKNGMASVTVFEERALELLNQTNATKNLPEQFMGEFKEAKAFLCEQNLPAEELALYKATTARNAFLQTVSKVFTCVFAVVMIVLIVVTTVFAIMYIWVKLAPNDYVEIPRAVCTEQNVCTYTVNLLGELSINRNAKGLVYYYGVKNPYLTDKNAHEENGITIDPGIDPSKNDLTKYKVADIANWSLTETDRQWIALYTTKDIRAGQPILADSLTIDENDWVYDASTVSVFDESSPCNMHRYLANAPKRYLHYSVESSYNPYAKALETVNGAASVFAEPSVYVVSGMTLLLGIVLGCGITAIPQRGKNGKNGKKENA